MPKSREEDLMSRIFAWSQKCLPTDSLLVARRKICSCTKLDNTFWICKISVTSKGRHRHHTPLDVTPGKAHHHVGDSCGLVTMSCLTLCHLMDYSPPDSSLWDFPGKNTWVGYHFLLCGSSQPRVQSHVSCIGMWILYCWATWEAPLRW